MNHRPLQKQYQQKATVKHHIIVDVIAIASVDIRTLNLSDRDKFGKVIYKGSGGGGGHKRLPLEEVHDFGSYFKDGNRKIKKGKHPQAVEYSTNYTKTTSRRRYRYDYENITIIKSIKNTITTRRSIRILINQ